MAWSLTVGGVSNPRPIAELAIDPETGTEIGDSECASVANAVVGA